MLGTLLKANQTEGPCLSLEVGRYWQRRMLPAHTASRRYPYLSTLSKLA